MQVTHCDACGVELQVGDYPFCPHGRARGVVIGDDVPGGFIAENGFAEPRLFYSKSAHAKALAAENCAVGARWVPGDKHLTRWDTVDLDNARALTLRNTEGARARNVERAAITVELGDTFRAKDLD